MVSNRSPKRRTRRTFFVAGSLTVLTRLESSLRMALAATPVVAVLKSIWLWPRRRAESLLGMSESMGGGGLESDDGEQDASDGGDEGHDED